MLHRSVIFKTTSIRVFAWVRLKPVCIYDIYFPKFGAKRGFKSRPLLLINVTKILAILAKSTTSILIV